MVGGESKVFHTEVTSREWVYWTRPFLAPVVTYSNTIEFYLLTTVDEGRRLRRVTLGTDRRRSQRRTHLPPGRNEDSLSL